MFRRPMILAAFVAIGLLGSSARADVTVSITEHGVTSTATLATGSPTTPGGVSGAMSFTLPDYTISFLSGKEVQTGTGASALSFLQSSTVSVTNTSGATGQLLAITITGNGFTAPTIPPAISIAGSSAFSATVTTLTAPGSMALTSSVQQAVVSPPLGGFTPQTITLTPPAPPTQSLSAPVDNTTITALTPIGPGSTFSIAEAVGLTLNEKGDTVNFVGTTTLSGVPPVVHHIPEPSTMALAGLGGLGLIGYGLRRRARGA
jgi:hypothetical protein